MNYYALEENETLEELEIKPGAFSMAEDDKWKDGISNSGTDGAQIKVILPNGDAYRIRDTDDFSKSDFFKCCYIRNGNVELSYDDYVKQIFYNKGAKEILDDCLHVLYYSGGKLDKSLPLISDYIVRYYVTRNQIKKLTELLESDIPMKIDFVRWIELAQKLEKNNMAALLLSHSNGEKASRRTRHQWVELKREPRMCAMTGARVEFSDKKSYIYECPYEINILDKVYVDGSRKDEEGTVISIKHFTKYYFHFAMDNFESYSVVKAFKLEFMEEDQSLEL